MVLVSSGPLTSQVVKVIRAGTGMGLKEAKDIVASPPQTIKQGIDKLYAEELKSELEAVGATVEIRATK